MRAFARAAAALLVSISAGLSARRLDLCRRSTCRRRGPRRRRAALGRLGAGGALASPETLAYAPVDRAMAAEGRALT
jgi:hypothetical protein